MSRAAGPSSACRGGSACGALPALPHAHRPTSAAVTATVAIRRQRPRTSPVSDHSLADKHERRGAAPLRPEREGHPAGETEAVTESRTNSASRKKPAADRRRPKRSSALPRTVAARRRPWLRPRSRGWLPKGAWCRLSRGNATKSRFSRPMAYSARGQDGMVSHGPRSGQRNRERTLYAAPGKSRCATKELLRWRSGSAPT